MLLYFPPMTLSTANDTDQRLAREHLLLETVTYVFTFYEELDSIPITIAQPERQRQMQQEL